MIDNTITIVTPTYNRAFILHKVYFSLKNQTDKKFKWMIIDDGSTDNTQELVDKWKRENNDFEIYYFKKNNGGKASALNYSFHKVDTEYFVCLDSDDIFTINAIESAYLELEKIKNIEEYCGILALRNSKNGIVLGGKEIPNGVTNITLSDLTNKYRIKSELICFYKTEKLVKYSFPVIAGEKFISPAFLEHKISKNYKFLASRESYCICEYLPDGLTKNKRKVIKNNPKGYTLVIREAYDLSTNFLIKSKYCLMYIAGSLISKDKNIIKNSPNKIMTLLYLPLGWAVYKIRFR